MTVQPEQVREAMNDIRAGVRALNPDPMILVRARAQLDQLVMAYRSAGVSDLFIGVACVSSLVGRGHHIDEAVLIVAAMEGYS